MNLQSIKQKIYKAKFTEQQTQYKSIVQAQDTPNALLMRRWYFVSDEGGEMNGHLRDARYDSTIINTMNFFHGKQMVGLNAFSQHAAKTVLL